MSNLYETNSISQGIFFNLKHEHINCTILFLQHHQRYIKRIKWVEQKYLWWIYKINPHTHRIFLIHNMVIHKVVLFSVSIEWHIRWAVYLGRTEQGPNAKINCLFSHRRHIFGHFLVFPIIFKVAFFLPIFITRHLLCACWVSVLLLTSLNNNYFGTSIECYDLLIPTRTNVCIINFDRKQIQCKQRWSFY